MGGVNYDRTCLTYDAGPKKPPPVDNHFGFYWVLLSLYYPGWYLTDPVVI